MDYGQLHRGYDDKPLDWGVRNLSLFQTQDKPFGTCSNCVTKETIIVIAKILLKHNNQPTNFNYNPEFVLDIDGIYYIAGEYTLLGMYS